MENQSTNGKAKRGFATMNPEHQRQIAREGGRIAHERGVAHKWSSAEAREAGRKGGKASGRNRTNENGGSPIL